MQGSGFSVCVFRVLTISIFLGLYPKFLNQDLSNRRRKATDAAVTKAAETVSQIDQARLAWSRALDSGLMITSWAP